MFDRDGSDAMRWFLMSSPVMRGGELIVTEQGIREGVRQVLIPLWNAWYFFALYANADKHDARWRTDSTHVLDRYLLAKTHELVEHGDRADGPLRRRRRVRVGARATSTCSPTGTCAGRGSGSGPATRTRSTRSGRRCTC